MNLAERVARRFRKEAHGDSHRDDLLHKVEAGVHRATEMLHALHQAHGFWSKTIGEGKSFQEAERAFRKVDALLKTYEHEAMDAMGNLEAVEDIERHMHQDVLDYPESYERNA